METQEPPDPLGKYRNKGSICRSALSGLRPKPAQRTEQLAVVKRQEQLHDEVKDLLQSKDPVRGALDSFKDRFSGLQKDCLERISSHWNAYHDDLDTESAADRPKAIDAFRGEVVTLGNVNKK